MKSAKCIYGPGRCHWVNGALKKKKKAVCLFIFHPFDDCTLHISLLLPDGHKATMKEEKIYTIPKIKVVLSIITQVQNSQIQPLKSYMDNFSRSVVQIVLSHCRQWLTSPLVFSPKYWLGIKQRVSLSLPASNKSSLCTNVMSLLCKGNPTAISIVSMLLLCY